MALTKIKVWSSKSAAVAALDAQIPVLHAKWSDKDESEAGMRGDYWHMEAVTAAVINARWHMRKVTTLGATGSYLVIGVTNNVWTQNGKTFLTKYPEYPADAPHTDPTPWVHSIAVIDGVIHDFTLRTSARYLWLDENGQPDPARGYMRTIRRIYRLTKCTGGHDCKGACNKRLRE